MSASWCACGSFDTGIRRICTTGGTGIASRDTTIEVVERLLAKTLVGFGELFRMLSWEEVGPAAMLSRATAGLAVDGTNEAIIFAMPGSSNAVNLAMSKLIGEVFEEFDKFSLDSLKPSYGIGLRFKFNQKENVNLRADLGFGENTNGIYFNVGEAF